MKYSPSDILRKFVLRQCIEHLVVTSEECYWFNLTFWENVTSKAFASKCWRRLSTALEREYPGFRLVGIWSRQARGAWHIHAVCNTRVDANWLRVKAMRAGFGPQIYLKKLDDRPETPEKISRYISGYCTDKNGLDKEKDKGVRRMIFVGKYVRVVTMRYKSELKKVTSMGRELAQDIRTDACVGLTDFVNDMRFYGERRLPAETWGEWYRRNRDYWFKVGYESLSEGEREVVESDLAVQNYLKTGRWSYI
jgi:hypothetical protein